MTQNKQMEIKCQAWLLVGFYEQCLKLVDKKCWGVWCFKHLDGRIMCRNCKHNND